MIITKKLKYGDFVYDEERQIFSVKVWDKNSPYGERMTNRMTFNKVYAFAFLRFVVRIAQRNWFRRKKK